MKEAVIVDVIRTAVGKFGGTLINLGPDEMMAPLLHEIVKRNGIAPDMIDLSIMGNVDNHSTAPNLGRLALLRAGFPHSIPGYTVEHQCGSSLAAINIAAMYIATGNADVIVAGGAENMSALPYWIDGARQGFRLGDDNLKIYCEFTETARRVCGPDLYPDMNMGLTAENLAEKYNITREEQDEFAIQSQTLARQSISSGRQKMEILPLKVATRKGEVTFDTDEHPRPDTNLEKLARLRPAFKKGGSVTAGNSSGLNDGAALTLIMSRNKAEELGLKPLVSIGKFCNVGVDPAIMGIAPADALRKIFAMAGTQFDDYGLFEINEAFAAQTLAVYRELGLSKEQTERINVNGGAIAFGHPLGASGARLAGTLIHEMRLRSVKKGIAALCCGGGIGVATELILE